MACCCREATGREKHHLWQPTLDPPLVLSNVAVVLVSPKRPTSVGSVARAMSCFECDDLRIVAPRCDPLARSARNSSKGAQYLLWRAQMCDTLDEALQGAAATVAFTRWVEGLPASYRSMSELMRAPEMAQRLLLGGGGAGQGGSTGTAEGKVVLVFGREVQGLFPEEVAQCGAACSIPIGRLQESLSLSHAVSLALGPLFEARQADARQLGNMSGVVSTAADLAMGVAQQDD